MFGVGDAIEIHGGSVGRWKLDVYPDRPAVAPVAASSRGLCRHSCGGSAFFSRDSLERPKRLGVFCLSKLQPLVRKPRVLAAFITGRLCAYLDSSRVGGRGVAASTLKFTEGGGPFSKEV